TVGPLKPDLYPYLFVVDGMLVLDPRNDQVKPGTQPMSLLEVPGEKPMPWEARDVPHGTAHVHWYPSAALGKPLRFHVYTPPGYGKSGKQYPTPYRLHGSGDSDASWVAAGRANFLLDNLLADGKVVPMVVVMPVGGLGLVDATEKGKPFPFEQELLENV